MTLWRPPYVRQCPLFLSDCGWIVRWNDSGEPVVNRQSQLKACEIGVGSVTRLVLDPMRVKGGITR